MKAADLVYDWSRRGAAFDYRKARITLNDVTLRDGLHSPSAKDPPLEAKLRLLHLMPELGIGSADLGFPATGLQMGAQVGILAAEIASARLPLAANAVARMTVEDVDGIAELSDEAGIPIEAGLFIAASDVRMEAEGWTLDHLLRMSEAAVGAAVRLGLPVMYVVEDASRARPEVLRALYGLAVSHGAGRLCLTDTAGAATPGGVKRLVNFLKDEVLAPSGVTVLLDWHGHRDRGLGLVNALAALEAGATRLHATALGVGERAGNTEMDLLLVNLKLEGIIDNDLSRLGEYCRLASEACGVPIPHNYPVFGKDAFETATGVHAAAVIKAFKKGDHWLANRVYSGVPADLFGLEQVIAVGPMSGKSNVTYFLEKRGIAPTDEQVARVLELAKRTPRLLTEAEILHAAGA